MFLGLFGHRVFMYSFEFRLKMLQQSVFGSPLLILIKLWIYVSFTDTENSPCIELNRSQMLCLLLVAALEIRLQYNCNRIDSLIDLCIDNFVFGECLPGQLMSNPKTYLACKSHWLFGRVFGRWCYLLNFQYRMLLIILYAVKRCDWKNARNSHSKVTFAVFSILLFIDSLSLIYSIAEIIEKSMKIKKLNWNWFLSFNPTNVDNFVDICSASNSKLLSCIRWIL